MSSVLSVFHLCSSVAGFIRLHREGVRRGLEVLSKITGSGDGSAAVGIDAEAQGAVARLRVRREFDADLNSRGSFARMTTSSERQKPSRCFAVAGPVPLKSATP